MNDDTNENVSLDDVLAGGSPEDNTPDIFKMGDDLIAVIRELVQLAILTGTNIVDHLRQIVIEVDSDTGKMVPTVEYVEQYNKMVEQLMAKAQEMMEEAAAENSQDVVLGDEDSLELPN